MTPRKIHTSDPLQREADILGRVDAMAAALAAYRETGARELPSVAGPKSRGVPRSFLKAVDDLVAAVEEATR